MSTADAKNQFRIERLSLRSFRQLALADIVFHPQFNYLIGGNGAGKTSVLDAVSYVLADLCGCTGEARYPTPADPETAMKACAYVKGQRLRWDLLSEPSPELTAAIPTDDRQETRPVIAWYGAYRTAAGVFTFLKRKQADLPGIPPYTKAYDGCLPFHKNKTTITRLILLLQGMPSAAYPDIASAWGAALEAVRTCMPECEDVCVMETREGTPEITVKLKASGWFPLSRLGGEDRGVLVMALDLACRAAWLNPHAGERAVRTTPGVALIEDLEVSLHPLRQRVIVDALQEAFPSVQFIATGHSPFILQSLKAGQAIDVTNLERREKDPSALSVEDITEQLMGVDLPQVSARQARLREAALQYLRLAETGKALSAEDKVAIGVEMDRLIAPFKEHAASYAYLKMKKCAAGIPDAEDDEQPETDGPQDACAEDLDENEDEDPEVPYACSRGIAYPQPSGGGYTDESIETIAEEVMGVTASQISMLRQRLEAVSSEYYRRLDEGGFASEVEKNQLRMELESLVFLLGADAAIFAEYELRKLHASAKDALGIELPQMSKRRQDMNEAAQQYYEILQQGKDTSEEEKARLSDKLDELTAPFSDDAAYHAFLALKRLAAVFGQNETPKPTEVDAADKSR